MRAHSTLLVAVLLLYSPIISFANSGGHGVVRFGICADQVSSVVLVEERSSAYGRLAIQLDREGTTKLESFSRRHIGKTVEVVFDGVVLLRTPVAATFSSGKVMSRKWSSVRAAQKFSNLLTDRSLEVPCGAIGAADANASTPN